MLRHATIDVLGGLDTLIGRVPCHGRLEKCAVRTWGGLSWRSLGAASLSRALVPPVDSCRGRGKGACECEWEREREREREREGEEEGEGVGEGGRGSGSVKVEWVRARNPKSLMPEAALVSMASIASVRLSGDA